MNAIAAACVVYYSLIATATDATPQQIITATHRGTLISVAASRQDGVEQHRGDVITVFDRLYQKPELIIPFLEELTAERSCDTAYTDATVQLRSARVVR